MKKSGLFKGRRAVYLLAGVLILAIPIIFLTFRFTYNYASAAAKPLENALAKRGGVKQCDRGDNGAGPDNTSPWYYAIYKISGDKQQANETVRQAAKDSGFSLVDDTLPPNPEDNTFLADHTSKTSDYLFLKPGKVDLSVKVFGSKAYSKDKFCTVSDNGNPTPGTTTILFQVSLPSF